MDLTEKEIIYSTDERFDLIKNLCHLSKNLYNASLYDVRQHYFETKSYRTWQSQRPIFTKAHNPDYYALQSHLAGEVLMQVGKQFIGFFNNKSNKKKRIPKYKDKNGFNIITFPKITISKQIEFDEAKQLYTYKKDDETANSCDIIKSSVQFILMRAYRHLQVCHYDKLGFDLMSL